MDARAARAVRMTAGRSFVRVGALLLAIAAASAGAASASEAEDVLAHVNALRSEHGQPPLRLDPRLVKTAEDRAREQAHAGILPIVPGTEGVLGRVKRDGYEAHAITELLASS